MFVHCYSNISNSLPVGRPRLFMNIASCSRQSRKTDHIIMLSVECLTTENGLWHSKTTENCNASVGIYCSSEIFWQWGQSFWQALGRRIGTSWKTGRLLAHCMAIVYSPVRAKGNNKEGQVWKKWKIIQKKINRWPACMATLQWHNKMCHSMAFPLGPWRIRNYFFIIHSQQSG